MKIVKFIQQQILNLESKRIKLSCKKTCKAEEELKAINEQLKELQKKLDAVVKI